MHPIIILRSLILVKSYLIINFIPMVFIIIFYTDDFLLNNWLSKVNMSNLSLEKLPLKVCTNQIPVIGGKQLFGLCFREICVKARVSARVRVLALACFIQVNLTTQYLFSKILQEWYRNIWYFSDAIWKIFDTHLPFNLNVAREYLKTL